MIIAVDGRASSDLDKFPVTRQALPHSRRQNAPRDFPETQPA